MCNPVGLGHPRLHLRRTDSTNERARALAIAGAPHGTLVTASEQTAGRGRQGRRWSAPPDSSLLCRSCCARPPPLLPLIAAVAVCDVAGEDARVKWPNDIVFVRAGPAWPSSLGSSPRAAPRRAGRCSASASTWRCGWRSCRRSCASERRHARAIAPRAIEPPLARLLDRACAALGEPTEALLDAWRARDALRGREIELVAMDTAAPRASTATGRLVVALAGGGHTALDAGEVHLRSLCLLLRVLQRLGDAAIELALFGRRETAAVRARGLGGFARQRFVQHRVARRLALLPRLPVPPRRLPEDSGAVRSLAALMPLAPF